MTPKTPGKAETVVNRREKVHIINSQRLSERQVIENNSAKRALLPGGLLLWRLLAAHLLGFEILVEKIQRLLVAAGRASDGKHALAALVMRSLGNGDASPRALPDFANLAAATANDAANHIRRNADVLGLDFLAVLGVSGRWRTTGGVGAGAATVGRWGVAEVGTMAGAIVGSAAPSTARTGAVGSGH